MVKSNEITTFGVIIKAVTNNTIIKILIKFKFAVIVEILIVVKIVVIIEILIMVKFTVIIEIVKVSVIAEILIIVTIIISFNSIVKRINQIEFMISKSIIVNYQSLLCYSIYLILYHIINYYRNKFNSCIRKQFKFHHVLIIHIVYQIVHLVSLIKTDNQLYV